MGQEAGKDSRMGEIMIPKHRFDCVSLCLKDTKQALTSATAENEELKLTSARLASALRQTYADRLLAEAGAKNIPATRALLDFTIIKLEQDDTVSGIEEQIAHIKETNQFLFESKNNTVYVLVPLEEPDRLLDSIQNLKKEVQ
jgi:hypothetical protein